MKSGMCKLNLHILWNAGSHSGYFHTMIPDSSYAGTKTTPGRASFHTHKRSFRRDFCSGAKLHRADLKSGESHIGFVPHFGEV